MKLRQARAHRDGLRQLIPYEDDRLRLERERLSAELDTAKAEAEQHRQIQKSLGHLVLVCGNVCRIAWAELHAIRAADLSDLGEFDRTSDQLEDAWSGLRHALENYSQSSD